jgi:predicted dehydrogenase
MPARVALLGSGIFARRQHAPAIEACPDLELVAVYSRSLKSASSLIQDLGLKGVEAYSDDGAAPLADLLARTDVDAVIVALPIVQQSAIVKQCLTAGKHVLSEKPVAKDVATAEALISAYESSLGLGRWIIVRSMLSLLTAPVAVCAQAEQFAYDLGFQRAAQVIAEGNIGDIRSFRRAPGHYSRRMIS